MASEVDIINMGLVLIGASKIETRDDDNDRARIGDLFYDDVRDAVLRAHTWGFALTQAELAAAAGSPVFTTKWDYHFTLPTTPFCLRVLEVEEEYPGEIPYSIQGRKLLCNESSIKILYIARITDTGNFDALFTDALAARLGSVFAMAIPKAQNRIELCWNLYIKKIEEATTVDGLESEKKTIYNDTLTRVR